MAFFDVIVQLFQKYKDFLTKDQYGNASFDIKSFIANSKREYK